MQAVCFFEEGLHFGDEAADFFVVGVRGDLEVLGGGCAVGEEIGWEVAVGEIHVDVVGGFGSRRERGGEGEVCAVATGEVWSVCAGWLGRKVIEMARASRRVNGRSGRADDRTGFASLHGPTGAGRACRMCVM